MQIKQWQAEKSEAEVAGVTFRPVITKMAAQLKRGASAGALPGGGANGEAGPSWLQRAVSRRTQERMEVQRLELQERQTKGCTFKPRLNSNSRWVCVCGGGGGQRTPGWVDQQKDALPNTPPFPLHVISPSPALPPLLLLLPQAHDGPAKGRLA